MSILILISMILETNIQSDKLRYIFYWLTIFKIKSMGFILTDRPNILDSYARYKIHFSWIINMMMV